MINAGGKGLSGGYQNMARMEPIQIWPAGRDHYDGGVDEAPSSSWA